MVRTARTAPPPPRTARRGKVGRGKTGRGKAGRRGAGGSAGARPEVVIVGAGPGGLASAMLLAHAGAKVTVLERRDRPGGRTSALEADAPLSDGTRGRFRFDTGPTFFLYPRVLGEVFATCGRDLMAEVPMTRLDPQYRLNFGSGGRLDATPDVAEMERQIAAICPADAGRFADYLAENREKLARFRPILESPFNSWRDAARPHLARMLPLVRPWLSLDGELKRHFSDPRLRVAFSFQSKYLGMSPFRCPSLFSILSFLEYEHGVWHPTGGCAAVSEKMAEIAVELGADLRLDTEVTGLRFEGKKPVAVETDGGPGAGGDLFKSDALVLNADFGRAMTRLVPDALRKNWTDAKLNKKKFSCSTFMLYLGVEGLEEDLPHHTIHIAEDYERNLREIETDRVLSGDPSVYVQNACVTDPSLAPDGHGTLYVLAPVTHESPHVDWDRDAPAFRETVLDQVESKFGVKNLRDRIRYEHRITPADWDGGYEIHKGATFNLAHNLTQMLHFRPRNRFEDLDGTYLVGGGTHPGSGLPVIYESARITTKLLAEDYGLAEVPGVALPLDAATEAISERVGTAGAPA